MTKGLAVPSVSRRTCVTAMPDGETGANDWRRADASWLATWHTTEELHDEGSSCHRLGHLAVQYARLVGAEMVAWSA